MQGKREANGRQSRKPSERQARLATGIELSEWDAMSAAIMARNRVHHVPLKNTRDQKAGSAIGRFCLQGHITEAQYGAALLYIESRNRSLRAIDAPRAPGAVDLNAARGRPVAAENIPLLSRWRREHRDAERAVQEKQNEIRLMGNLFGALDLVLFRDVELDYLLGDLRTALNALVKHYRLLVRAAA